MDILIKVTRERYYDIISIDDDMNFAEMTNKQAYDYMTQFVVGANGEYLPQAEARKLFKNVPSKELPQYIKAFVDAIRDAFVPKVNGPTSDELS